MSNREAIRFSSDVVRSLRLQEQLQSQLNELLTAVADLARQKDLQIKVEELAEFIAGGVLGESPEEAADADHEWNQLLGSMLKRVKVQDPNHQMFKTMSVGSMESGLSSELQAAVEAARRRTAAGEEREPADD